MATAEELLNSISENQVSVLSEDDGIFVIDGESRTITVPDSERLFGVEGDKDVERKYFQCPKIVGDNIDLSQHQIYVSYVFTTTENNTAFPTIGNGLYHCDDVEVSGDNITFSWLLSGNVFANPGFIAFKVMAKKSEGGELKTKWNTAPAVGTVLLTVPDGEEIEEEYPDVINQIFDRLDALEAGGGSGTGGTTNYENLSNKPQLNGVTLEGNKTLDDVGAVALNQGIDNAGKILCIGEDGNVEPVDSTGGGDTVNVDAELKEYMNVAKPAIASAIINKGGTVDDDDSLGDYATRISAIPNDVYPAETLPEQTNLSASGLQDSVGIKLNWSDVNANGYLIVRKENAKPTTSADGTIVYNSTYPVDGYTDTGVQKGKVYYYRIFPRNSKNQYQSLEDGAVAMVDYKDRTGETLLGDLPLGTKIKFGQWESSDFFWEIVDTQDKNKGYVTCAADKNLGNRMFDAPETNNSVTNRKNQGNNRWLYSAVRQLLNSSEVAGSWWTAQHEYDVAPSYATQIDGFLKDFTTYEKNIIVSKTNRCNLDTNDGGGSETMIDKVWLPSSYAMSLELFQPLEDEHTYEAYTDNASRVYQSNWWLRTINESSSASGVRVVNSYGTLGNYAANSNVSVAVRPFCLLPTSAYMLWSDSDEAYVFADDSQRNPTV